LPYRSTRNHELATKFDRAGVAHLIMQLDPKILDPLAKAKDP